MSYAMTHLIIANEFAAQTNRSNKDLFLLASIAPDAVHARTDFTSRLKADAHDLQPEENWGEIYTQEAMEKWYHRLKQYYEEKKLLVTNEKELTFLQGYTLHILVDIFNCKLLYAKNLIRYQFQVDAMRGEYRRECILQDNYLYQNCTQREQIMEALRRALKNDLTQEMLEHLQLTPYISVQNVEDNTNYQINLFQQAQTASLDGLEMVSAESSYDFLNEVREEAIRLLYEFPRIGKTFQM